MPVPASFAHAADGTEDLPNLDWKAYYSHPALKRLAELALENSPQVDIARERVETARARYALVSADRYPTVGASASGTSQRTADSLSPFGSGQSTEYGQVGLGASSWEIDVWGRLRNLRGAALEEYLASDEARRGVMNGLIGDTMRAYITILELNERIALAEKTVASRTESHRILSRRVDVGSAAPIDLTLAESLLSQARTELKSLQQARDLAGNALTLLIGTSPPEDLFEAQLADIAMAETVPAGLSSDILLQRPDIRAAEHMLSAREADIAAARAAYFPSVSLTGQFGFASTELSSLFESGSRAWTFTPSVNLPIFDAGRRDANLALTQSQARQALAEYELEIQSAFREVSDALATAYWLDQQIDEQMRTLNALEERARLANRRYEAGAANYLEVLDAERERFRAEQALVEARAGLIASKVDIFTALGGGVPGFETNVDEAPTARD